MPDSSLKLLMPAGEESASKRFSFGCDDGGGGGGGDC